MLCCGRIEWVRGFDVVSRQSFHFSLCPCPPWSRGLPQFSPFPFTCKAPILLLVNTVNRTLDKLLFPAGLAILLATATPATSAADSAPTLAPTQSESRRPTNDTELRYWLENMAVFHRFTTDEISAATGMTANEISAALTKFQLLGKSTPRRAPGDPLRVLPYPGGRHPRIGFLEGALRPQRETKVSVFTPWDDASYVVVDVPEAIFANLGLIYLAHTHIPTVWEAKGVTLPQLEWNRRPDGSLDFERTLPNGIAFGTKVTPKPDAVRMDLWLRNGTKEKLTGLRVQNCIMLKQAAGFTAQTSTNKLFQTPYAVARSEDGQRWIITGWDPCDRCWGNEQVPCIHADPKFPDCPPGETVRLRGWLSFYEGKLIEPELKRIEATGWRK